ncbi:aldo-keto reductase-3 [Coleophoma cylindrospora]|uniref:Aldo-keto reductase-3 n=1 Tax=Coleophoma cylindrospora TaxID=1849047 RepID=A0A3D8QNQ3_9HELO|nr:aldo-keto reductase-3 [Coleophoma cylindrospora]
MRISTQLSLVLATGAVAPGWAYELQKPFVSSAKTTIAQPPIGFGTWNLALSPQNTTEAVSLAIQAGYRQIDGAAIYRNEVAVGKGIAEGLKKANLTREEIWVTSKLWNDHHGDVKLAEEALSKTLEDLGLDYLDLYLMHWPVGTPPGEKPSLSYVETWKSMIALPKEKVRNIGISNFSPAQLTEIIAKTGVKPFAHQMEMHPYLPQSAWLATHKALGISVTAYSPLGNSNPIYRPGKDAPPPLLKNDEMLEIASSTNCTPAQVALKWGMERGTSVIPKSAHEVHFVENLQALECNLGHKDLAKIDLLASKYLTRFSNPSKSWGVKLFEGLEDA